MVRIVQKVRRPNLYLFIIFSLNGWRGGNRTHGNQFIRLAQSPLWYPPINLAVSSRIGIFRASIHPSRHLISPRVNVGIPMPAKHTFPKCVFLLLVHIPARYLNSHYAGISRLTLTSSISVRLTLYCLTT